MLALPAWVCVCVFTASTTDTEHLRNQHEISGDRKDLALGWLIPVEGSRQWVPRKLANSTDFVKENSMPGISNHAHQMRTSVNAKKNPDIMSRNSRISMTQHEDRDRTDTSNTHCKIAEMGRGRLNGDHQRRRQSNMRSRTSCSLRIGPAWCCQCASPTRLGCTTTVRT